MGLIIFFTGIVLITPVLENLNGLELETLTTQLGKNAALAGFALLALQFVLAARIRWIERPFGLDILIRFHRHMAFLAMGLLIAHPVLVAAGTGKWSLLVSIDQPAGIWLGKAALVLLVITVTVSAFQRKLKLKWERWRFAHNLAAPSLLAAAFFHAWLGVEEDVIELASVRYILALFLAGALILFAWHRLIRPSGLKRRPWSVTEVIQEAGKVWTVTMIPPEGETVPYYLPGQFHFITFLRGRGLPEEEHHWTISSSPAQKKSISSTIKELGDFTATIGETRPGDRAVVHGPFGRFSCMLHPEEHDLVFFAGGIGITPLMSMIRYLHDTDDDRRILLIYGNIDEGTIVFKEELARIQDSDSPDLTVVHVLSEPGDEWKGERGFLDREKIQAICGQDLDGKVFYVCGPPPMIASVLSALQELGVKDDRIRLEVFSFLD